MNDALLNVALVLLAPSLVALVLCVGYSAGQAIRALRREGHMTIVCAWCGRRLRVVRGGGVTGVSHGICRACADRWLTEAER